MTLRCQAAFPPLNETLSSWGPCHVLKRQMASGVSYGEQLVYDIERLRRHFPAVPVKIILIDVELPEVEQRERERLIAEQGVAESLEDQEGE